MDSLKHVAEKVKNSPLVIRKKFATPQSPYAKVTEGQPSKDYHQEDWLHAEEALREGIPFYVKLLGKHDVFEAQGSGCTDEAVQRIIESTKKKKNFHSYGSSLQKVLLTVSTRTLTIEDMISKENIMEVPIYRVSYCTSDPNYTKVFAMICRAAKTRDLKCYAFLCSKDSMAQAIALTVADAFKIVYEAYEKGKTEQISKNSNLNQKASPPVRSDNTEKAQRSFSQITSSSHSSGQHTPRTNTATAMLDPPHIEITKDFSVDDSSRKMQALDLAVDDDDFDVEFTKLAESRSNPNLFETPVRRRDLTDDVNHLMATEHTAKALMMSKSSEDLLSL